MRDIAMETAVRPICGASDEAVLYRIVVDVIDVALEIRLVTDYVLPISTLPNAVFSFDDFTGRA